jgi:hypothetical protein
MFRDVAATPLFNSTGNVNTMTPVDYSPGSGNHERLEITDQLRTTLAELSTSQRSTMDTSARWFRLSDREGPIWGSRGREFKFRQPDQTDLLNPTKSERHSTDILAAVDDAERRPLQTRPGCPISVTSASQPVGSGKVAVGTNAAAGTSSNSSFSPRWAP